MKGTDKIMQEILQERVVKFFSVLMYARDGVLFEGQEYGKLCNEAIKAEVEKALPYGHGGRLGKVLEILQQEEKDIDA